ncbi:hypothetical protein AGMMS49983_15900 [Clostridia bacterium]|nr:hypothetical protein AGMMS49983_15900 [Clostridia bacterium]
MSNTSIQVNKLSVKQLLESGKDHKFIIPEYQRPYAWTDEQVQILLDDLIEYTTNKAEKGDDDESSYFLGSIVSYENEEKEQEIIDGQQRITTLFLLLRAIHKKLDDEIESKEVNFLKAQIEPCVWKINKEGEVSDFSDIHVYSNVMGDEGNRVFANILEKGKADNKGKDNYSKNYLLIQNAITKFAADNPTSFRDFVRNILNDSILLPITADTQDTALTIFSTLNDRGLALSDADIFKAKIYNRITPEDKKRFIEKWQQLDERANEADESIQKLFYYYMFYLRALDNDRKTTTPGIRKYYAQNNFQRLDESEILDKLDTVLNLWVVVNNREEIDEETWTTNMEIRKVLDVLLSYPNEFWKYPVVIYYLENRTSEHFEAIFLRFLRKLFATLSARYIVTPTINAVKTGILNLNADIINFPEPTFSFSSIDEETLKEKIKNPHRNTVRMILKLLAYQRDNQVKLLPEKWEIEHILPQNYQKTYFSGESDDEIKQLIEHIGNKVPFEKKLNIIASDGYFAKKKEQYAKSEIAIVKDLSKTSGDNWKLDNIREQDIRVSDELMRIYKDWGLNQNPNRTEESVVSKISDEDKATLEDLKRRGVIQ